MIVKRVIEFLKPDFFVYRISDVKVEKLIQLGVKGLILDVDNTLLSRKSDKLSKDVSNWLSNALRYFKIIILSNNSREKILRAARSLNIPYISWTLKPLTLFYKIALLKLGLPASEVCVIGDQIFTDILGGKLIGAKTIYVNPIKREEDSDWTKFIRLFEKKLLKRWKVKI